MRKERAEVTYLEPIMGPTFVCLQNAYVEVITLNFMVLGGGAFGE